MDARGEGLVARHLTPIVTSRMTEEPVVLLQGPRSVGKSTLLRGLAVGMGAEIVDLDDVAVREAAARDPGTFTAGPSPVLIDEYQHVPLVLDAIKAELNRVWTNNASAPTASRPPPKPGGVCSAPSPPPTPLG